MAAGPYLAIVIMVLLLCTCMCCSHLCSCCCSRGLENPTSNFRAQLARFATELYLLFFVAATQLTARGFAGRVGDGDWAGLMLELKTASCTQCSNAERYNSTNNHCCHDNASRYKMLTALIQAAPTIIAVTTTLLLLGMPTLALVTMCRARDANGNVCNEHERKYERFATFHKPCVSMPPAPRPPAAPPACRPFVRGCQALLLW